MTNKLKIGVLASGGGTNLQAIIDSCSENKILVEVAVVISDVEHAFALQRAKNAGIPGLWINQADYEDKQAFEYGVVGQLEKYDVDLVVLAGYMRLVGKHFLASYPGRIMNIHPSLLPAFPGVNGIRDAFEYGVKVAGVTVHFVDEGMDTGPIILQESVGISENDSLETLQEKIHKVEHELYPQAIKLYTEGRLILEGRKVRIKEK
jgi:phosphoribosylglycinamide formyltransferase-1